MFGILAPRLREVKFGIPEILSILKKFVMRLEERENIPSPGFEVRLQKLEDAIGGVRGDLLSAIQAQRQLQDQLRSVVEELSGAPPSEYEPGRNVWRAIRPSNPKA